MRKLITKTLFLISLVPLLVTSCKKDTIDVAVGTISANIDGVKTTFSVSAKASVVSVQNGFGIKIFGYKKDPTISGTSLQIVIVRPTSVTSGTYTENAVDNPLVQVNYFYDLFFGAGVSYSNNHSLTSPITISITNISAGSVNGTFQGELEGIGFNGAATKSKITNGMFNVRF